MMIRRHFAHIEVSCELTFSTEWIKVYSHSSRDDFTTRVIICPILCPLMISRLAYNYLNHTTTLIL